mmetsp:Transcript_6415/g.18799  ORF Transcript_6415/g.18799 Transcript_6415/m.18799 type:complete len:224 (-) Transcript_6415:2792-3463(-)
MMDFLEDRRGARPLPPSPFPLLRRLTRSWPLPPPSAFLRQLPENPKRLPLRREGLIMGSLSRLPLSPPPSLDPSSTLVRAEVQGTWLTAMISEFTLTPTEAAGESASTPSMMSRPPWMLRTLRPRARSLKTKVRSQEPSSISSWTWRDAGGRRRRPPSKGSGVPSSGPARSSGRTRRSTTRRRGLPEPPSRAATCLWWRVRAIGAWRLILWILSPTRSPRSWP